MLDLKFIRNNPEVVKAHLADKHIENGAALVDKVLQLDERRRASLAEVELLKRQRNEASQQVARLKKSGGDASEIIERTRHLGDQIANLDADGREVEAALERQIL